ncbi:class F sortase [Pseudarthrobacter sp. L1SW]|uniref:class F sortase n=1 Tax=Pseudarthrobacter sp. L1SW TaxID=2851598 RepID=UPI001E39A98F|nr:class F sortase [Pseudarthrobacter sp. L1SW]UEL27224.1 class F sortase [Pseudarthrobacter sp. L1SW]
MAGHHPEEVPGAEAKSSTTGHHRRRAIFKTTLLLAVAGIVGFVAVALLPVLVDAGGRTPHGGAPAVASQLPTHAATGTAPVTPGPDIPSEVPSEMAGPPVAPPQRLIYPAADIDVPVYPLDPSSSDVASQTIIPPPTMDGYWLTPYGMPGSGSTNTTYVVGHSWQDLEAPFNRLSSKAAAGDSLTVVTSAGELEYRVDSVTTYVKSGLKDSPIWEVAPNRLVLISCYTDDLWGTNVVVTATPVAG